MPLNWKRIVALIAFIGFSLLIGFLLYYIFLRPSSEPPVIPVNNAPLGNTGSLPNSNSGTNIPIDPNLNQNINTNTNQTTTTVQVNPIANGGITKTNELTTRRVISPILGQSGTEAYFYDRNTGLFYRIDSNGTVNQLDDKIFYEVQNVIWAPNKNQVILEYPDGSNILYSFETKRQVTLPRHWKDFYFSPESSQIVFKSMGTDPENRWLAIANPDGSRAQKIEHLGTKDTTVLPSWSPSNQIIAMYLEDKDLERQTLFFLGKNNENFSSMTLEGRGFRGQWSPNGERMLYSVYSSATDNKPTLWIAAASGESIGDSKRNLRLTTWADRCAFANESEIYCAVPKNLPSDAGLFYNDLDNSPSDIYKIDLKNGLSNRIAIPSGDYNITQLMVTSDQENIYFTDKESGKLYTIRIQ